jgi:lipoate-protein ligase A
VSAFDRLDVYYDERRSAALNMAVDEALLERTTRPAIRFYGWARPALSFGYFGEFEEAAKAGEGRDLVRRWTGGGIVLHGSDLTYSIVIPVANHSFSHSPSDLYSNVHAAIRQVLFEEGINAVLAEYTSPKISEACFANPAHADVLVDGTKVAGAAQRRTRTGLLQQGSIQHPDLPHDFASRLVQKLYPNTQMLDLRPDFIEYAQGIAAQKYATEQWLRRR